MLLFFDQVAALPGSWNAMEKMIVETIQMKGIVGEKKQYVYGTITPSLVYSWWAWGM